MIVGQPSLINIVIGPSAPTEIKAQVTVRGSRVEKKRRKGKERRERGGDLGSLRKS